MTVATKTCRHVRKNQSSIHGKGVLPSTQRHNVAQDSIPVGKGMSVAHVRSIAASRLATVPHMAALCPQHMSASIHICLSIMSVLLSHTPGHTEAGICRTLNDKFPLLFSV